MFKKFMNGRYGMDDFNRIIAIVFLVIAIISAATTWFLLIPAVILFGYFMFRLISKDKEKRKAEDLKFKQILNRIYNWFALQIKKIKNHKTTRYITCPGCKTVSSLPAKKGNFTLICPKCGTRFKAKIR